MAQLKVVGHPHPRFPADSWLPAMRRTMAAQHTHYGACRAMVTQHGQRRISSVAAHVELAPGIGETFFFFRRTFFRLVRLCVGSASCQLQDSYGGSGRSSPSASSAPSRNNKTRTNSQKIRPPAVPAFRPLPPAVRPCSPLRLPVLLLQVCSPCPVAVQPMSIPAAERHPLRIFP